MTAMADISRQTIPMGDMPRTVDEAVARLTSELPLKDRVAIAKMNKRELSTIHVTLGPHIREQFGFWRGNEELMESCRIRSGRDRFDVATGSAIIIDTMWAKLRQTHTLKAVK
jgi:Domain of unknown function (DUF6794)